MNQKNTTDVHPFINGDDSDLASPQCTKRSVRRLLRKCSAEMYCMTKEIIPELFMWDQS